MGEPLQRFGKYQLVARLAKGGMAQTWRARLTADAGVTKEVVIKKVLPHFAEDEGFITAFIDEARISASLSHGNIAQVFDFGRVDGEYFLAMEWIEGRSLAQVLDRAEQLGFARLPISIACFLAIEVLRGLHYAHTRTGADGAPLRIVHRDVTPENVLLGFEGQTKLVDFGVAKAVLQGRKETEPGLVKGKFLFFSPEQASAEPLDARSDVFAVGVILYRMLCGVLPFDGPMLTVMKAIVSGNFRSAAEVNPALPSALAAVVAKALATAREERFSSALEMQEALTSFLNRHDPQFSGETVKEWMLWLYREELQAEGRAVVLSDRFVAQLKQWGGTAEPSDAPTQLNRALSVQPIVTTLPAVTAPDAKVTERVASPSRWPWLVGAGLVVAGAVAGIWFSASSPHAAPRHLAFVPPIAPLPVEEVVADAGAAPEARPLYYGDGQLLTRWDPDAGQLEADPRLQGRSLRELTVMRNWIFARAGYTFHRKWLAAFFVAQPWYQPEKLDESNLTPADGVNADTIASWEADLRTPELLAMRDSARARGDTLELRLLSARLGGWAGDGPAPEDLTPLEDPAKLDQPVTRAQLEELSPSDLRLLRNTLYARRGRAYVPEPKGTWVQGHFATVAWYHPDPAYTDARLTPIDRKNLELINSVEAASGAGPRPSPAKASKPVRRTARDHN